MSSDAENPTPRSWWLVSGGAVLVTAAIVFAVAVLPQALSSPGRGGPGPDRVDTTPVPVERVVPVVYVAGFGASVRLVEGRRAVSSDNPVRSALNASVRGLAGGSGQGSLWPYRTVVTSFFEAGDPLRMDLENDEVDLAEKPLSMSRRQAELSVQQLVHTARAGLDRDDVAVRFTIAGAPTRRLLGVDVSRPVRPAPRAEVFDPV